MKVRSIIVSSRRGMTLIELMIVLAIIVLMAGFVGPSLVQAIQGPALTRAAGTVQYNLEAAHQYALTLQNTVEVRFYQYPPSTGNFCALQLIEVVPQVSSTGVVSMTSIPLTQVMRLPAPIIMITTTTPYTYSSLLSSSALTITNPISGTDPSIPGVGLNYDYVQFSFLPNGGTNLPLTPPTGVNGYYVTVAASTQASQPKNFYTIQVDPLTGKVAFYRP